MTPDWTLDPSAIEPLSPRSGPFTDARFLAALEQLTPKSSGHRVGAVATDGARAAITLVRYGSEAVSVPYGYGGIVGDRALARDEVSEILRLAARALDVRRVVSRYLPLPSAGRPAHGGGRVMGTTAVVALAGPEDDVHGRLAKKARQSIRRAERAGIVVRRGEDPSGFLATYESASTRFATVYPPELLRHVHGSGLGRTYDAWLGERVVASAFALIGAAEWMYWLAAASDDGRRTEAGYPVLAELLSDARDAGARFVNLGASADLPGVAKFKRRMAGVDVSMIEHVEEARTVSLQTVRAVWKAHTR